MRSAKYYNEVRIIIEKIVSRNISRLFVADKKSFKNVFFYPFNCGPLTTVSLSARSILLIYIYVYKYIFRHVFARDLI